MKINLDGTEEITFKGLPLSMASLWFNKVIERGYTVGDGVFRLRNGKWKEEPRFTIYYTNKIRGQANNDIVICGGGGDIAHFNGIEWRDYLNNPLEEFYGNLNSIDIKGNTVCAVGTDGFYAIIILGTR